MESPDLFYGDMHVLGISWIPALHWRQVTLFLYMLVQVLFFGYSKWIEKTSHWSLHQISNNHNISHRLNLITCYLYSIHTERKEDWISKNVCQVKLLGTEAELVGKIDGCWGSCWCKASAQTKTRWVNVRVTTFTGTHPPQNQRTHPEFPYTLQCFSAARRHSFRGEGEKTRLCLHSCYN